ncbi:MAG: site-specific DNA-methyltransferase [Lachnospiraceae bacterium]|mgnify:CR=1 FL=1|jgi:DNA methylase N-4/N-6 domain protein
MPTLEWIGKDKVVNHHQEVPFRILDKKYTFNAENSDNMIIHGDNLLALKSLLPQYEGLIDCIYIDPPYNTGKKEGQWVYSDNVDDPRIKKWLGEVVGAEGEDLSRHDKWLCMMYPRLKLLHKLLSNEGIIFISIDDNELASLKLCCDEIFGSSNFIGYLSVEINPKGRKNSDFISISNDYCVIYAKNKKDTYFLENIPKDKKDLSVDENGNLVHNSGKRVLVGENSFNNIVEDFNSKKHYTIYYNAEQGDMILKKETSLSEIDEDLVSKGYARYYSYSGEKFVENTYTADKIVELFENKALDFKNGKIYEKNFSSSIRIKSILSNRNYQTYDSNGNVIDYKIDVKTTSAGQELKDIFETTATIFNNPKNKGLIEILISLIDNKNALVLDSFGGSGTTAHAVLNLNKKDNGNRKFILVEMMDYADTITAERVKRVINGYGEGNKAVAGIPGDFTYYELGQPLFKDDKNLNEEVPEEEIRKYVYYMETKKPLETETTDNPYLLGKNNDTAYYFYYKKDEITTLNHEFLSTINTKATEYIVYADKCVLAQEVMEKFNIVFKKIPRDITRL